MKCQRLSNEYTFLETVENSKTWYRVAELAMATHLKVVWRKIVSSTEGRRRGRACEAWGGGGERPLLLGYFGDLPREFFKFWAPPSRVFNAFSVKLMILVQISIVLVKFLFEKIFLDAPETYSWTKSFSDSHNSACFFDIILPTCQGRFYF